VGRAGSRLTVGKISKPALREVLQPPRRDIPAASRRPGSARPEVGNLACALQEGLAARSLGREPDPCSCADADNR
jgi:hypothetical protein